MRIVVTNFHIERIGGRSVMISQSSITLIPAKMPMSASSIDVDEALRMVDLCRFGTMGMHSNVANCEGNRLSL